MTDLIKQTFLKRYIIVILAMILVVLLLSSQFYLVYYANVNSNKVIELKGLGGEIIYYDEALTMTARLAAHSGDIRFEKRYSFFEEKLDEVLDRASTLLNRDEVLTGTAKIDQANERLIAFERRAFQAVRNGNAERAVEILFSDDYERLKAIYRQGLFAIDQSLEEEMQDIIDNMFIMGIIRNLSVIIVLFLVAYFSLRNVRAHEKALSADLAKSEFLATMSHEIRTPMNGILGMGQLLENSELSKKQYQYVQAIMASGRSLMQILNDILDFSKIESKRLEITHELFDLHQICLNVVNLMKASAQDKGIELVLRYNLEEKEFIGDGQRVQQILNNLVSNALKFTEKGMVLLDVTVMEQGEEQSTIRFDVSDTGIGIEEHLLPTIFDRFTQADQSATRRFGGTGLGLAICKKLVDLMGGEISVLSEFGQGSTFSFTLPLEKIVRSEETSLLMERLKNGVMIFSKQDLAATPLVETLDKMGVVVDFEDNLSKAFEHLKKADEKDKPYDLLIIDWYDATDEAVILSRLLARDEELSEIMSVQVAPENIDVNKDINLDNTHILGADLFDKPALLHTLF